MLAAQCRRVLLLLLVCSGPLLAATLPTGFTETQVAQGVVRPTAMALAPDGRVFVAEQTGKLRVIKGGQLLAEPFLTVPVDAQGERGLVGVEVHPDFPRTPYVYVYYTAPRPVVHNRISRFTASGDRAAKGSETVLLELPELAKPIHNGGAMHFGPDGKLYVAVGENAVPENAQSLDNPLGKILRLEPDGSIPEDNPFYDRTEGLGRAIWALGLRNPFTFAFQPGTGRMLINDVGRKEWEEINEGVAGANYGWPLTEGPTNDPAFRAPIHVYRHGPGPETGCAITGGAFYDPVDPRFPAEYQGSYFFADFCSGWIRRLAPDGRAFAFATGIAGPVDLEVAADGSLYYLQYESGAVTRISHTGDPAPQITAQPADLTVPAGAAATFTAAASGEPPLRYQWRRDGADIAGATALHYTLPVAALSDHGAAFDVVVSNDRGSATSRAARLSVVSNQPPVAAIAAPADRALYTAGDTIAYAGTGADAEDGTLPASALTWRVDFHHDTHFHPFLPAASGAAEGSFLIPTTGESAANVWYRVHLTVKDSAGLSHSTFVDVVPRTARITFTTVPSGLKLMLDGGPRTAPFTETGVAGFLRTLGAPSPQTLGGSIYEFVSWSDRGAASHDIITPGLTPGADATWTATFRPVAETRHGLSASYFDDLDLRELRKKRTDPFVDFRWKDGAPLPGMGADTFSVRWTGQVEARVSGRHRFWVRSDDGVRLWVNGKLLIDGWHDSPSRLSRGAIELVAGRRYDLRLEYYDNTGEASVRLQWSAPGLPRQVIPAGQLYAN